MAVLETMWWGYWGKHGGTEDCMERDWGTHGGTGNIMVGVLGDAWRYWGQYTGSTGRRVEVLGAILWEYCGTHGGVGSSVVDVPGDAWRYWGVPLTPGTTQRGYWGIPLPLKQTRGTVLAGVYIA